MICIPWCRLRYLIYKLSSINNMYHAPNLQEGPFDRNAARFTLQENVQHFFDAILLSKAIRS